MCLHVVEEVDKPWSVSIVVFVGVGVTEFDYVKFADEILGGFSLFVVVVIDLQFNLSYPVGTVKTRF